MYDEQEARKMAARDRELHGQPNPYIGPVVATVRMEITEDDNVFDDIRLEKIIHRNITYGCCHDLLDFHRGEK